MVIMTYFTFCSLNNSHDLNCKMKYCICVQHSGSTLGTERYIRLPNPDATLVLEIFLVNLNTQEFPTECETANECINVLKVARINVMGNGCLQKTWEWKKYNNINRF